MEDIFLQIVVWETQSDEGSEKRRFHGPRLRAMACSECYVSRCGYQKQLGSFVAL